MPKSAFAANAQAKVCAAAVAALLARRDAPTSRGSSTPATAWSRPTTASRVAGVYRPVNGVLTDVDGCRRGQPGRCAARDARARSDICRSLVQDDHGRGLRLSWCRIVAAGAAGDRVVTAGRCSAGGAAALSDRRRCDSRFADRRAWRSGARPRDRRGPPAERCLLCHSGPFPGGEVPR